MADMITFQNPVYLNFGWFIPVILLAFFINRRNQIVIKKRLGDTSKIDYLISGGSFFVSSLKFILIVLAIFFLILALANPVKYLNSYDQSIPAQTEIVFVTDLSKSMMAEDVIPNRLQQVKSFQLSAINEFQGEEVGIVVFAGKAVAYMPFNIDYTFISSTIKSISLNVIQEPGTSIHEALRIAAYYFGKDNDIVKLICLFSDGEAHKNDYDLLADSLRKSGIDIFTFGAGTEVGTSIPVVNGKRERDKNGLIVTSRLNEFALKNITGNKQGRYFKLLNKEVALKDFLKQLKIVETSKLKKKEVIKSYFQTCLLVAFFLLLLEILIPAHLNLFNEKVF